MSVVHEMSLTHIVYLYSSVKPAKTNKEYTIWKRAGEGLSLTQGRGRNGHILEVLQGLAAQVCIKIYIGLMLQFI